MPRTQWLVSVCFLQAYEEINALWVGYSRPLPRISTLSSGWYTNFVTSPASPKRNRLSSTHSLEISQNDSFWMRIPSIRDASVPQEDSTTPGGFGSASSARGRRAEGQGSEGVQKNPPCSSAPRRCLRVSVASSSPAQVFKCQKESQGHNAAGCDEGGSDTHRPKSITAPNRTQDASQTAHGLGNPHDPSLLVYAAVARQQARYGGIVNARAESDQGEDSAVTRNIGGEGHKRKAEDHTERSQGHAQAFPYALHQTAHEQSLNQPQQDANISEQIAGLPRAQAVQMRIQKAEGGFHVREGKGHDEEQYQQNT